jgi:hypothetical protein
MRCWCGEGEGGGENTDGENAVSGNLWFRREVGFPRRRLFGFLMSGPQVRDGNRGKAVPVQTITAKFQIQYYFFMFAVLINTMDGKFYVYVYCYETDASTEIIYSRNSFQIFRATLRDLLGTFFHFRFVVCKVLGWLFDCPLPPNRMY